MGHFWLVGTSAVRNLGVCGTTFKPSSPFDSIKNTYSRLGLNNQLLLPKLTQQCGGNERNPSPVPQISPFLRLHC